MSVVAASLLKAELCAGTYTKQLCVSFKCVCLCILNSHRFRAQERHGYSKDYDGEIELIKMQVQCRCQYKVMIMYIKKLDLLLRNETVNQQETVSSTVLVITYCWEMAAVYQAKCQTYCYVPLHCFKDISKFPCFMSLKIHQAATTLRPKSFDLSG